MEDILEAIASNFLCVRRLPFEVRTTFRARENEETREGFEETYWKPTIEYFDKTNYPGTVSTSQDRMKRFYEAFPNGQRMFTQVRKVENGGWWIVKQVKDTGSTVIFNTKYDKFFAPTLKEAVDLFLKSQEGA